MGEHLGFQTGGFGEIPLDEYRLGSERVRAFLRSWHAHADHWVVPEPDEEGPEGERGYEEALTEGLRALAHERGLRLVRLTFHEPEGLSTLVADCYRWWYRQRGIGNKRLIASCFAMAEPRLMIRSTSAPLWLSFNTARSARLLERYLSRAGSFGECYALLMADNVRRIGLTPIDDWERLLSQARTRHGIRGIDPRAYPADFACSIRYQPALARMILQRIPPPAPLTPDELSDFAARRRDVFELREEEL